MTTLASSTHTEVTAITYKAQTDAAAASAASIATAEAAVHNKLPYNTIAFLTRTKHTLN